MVRKTQFPRLVIPLAVVLTCLFNLAVNMRRGVRVHARDGRVAALDVAAVPARGDRRSCVLTTAVAMMLSALHPRFRDTGIIWSVAVTALFYATPVLYPLEIVPASARASCWR